jgi:hypothetical protein
LPPCAYGLTGYTSGHDKTAASGLRGPDQSFKGLQFTAEVILWAVRWYLMFPVSYRDLELMLQDRGMSVDHATAFRWIQAYAPEIEKRIRPHLRPSNGSWRVDETYITDPARAVLESGWWLPISWRWNIGTCGA